jgi:Holliday junction resolvasome RuvABC endonuclease subunit
VKKIIKKERIVKVANSEAEIRVLGLDCSSSTIGWGLVALGDEPHLLAYGHIKPLDSKHGLIERLDGVYETIKTLCEEFEPTHISVEDILLFMKGKSQARTITILAAFNRVVALSAYRNSNAKVVFYPSQTIRKIIKDACEFPKRIKKEEMPDLIISKLEPTFKVIINRKGNEAEETYDEADGIAAAWACVLELKNEESL